MAERAGVSKSTVSNVIRGTAVVAEETRIRSRARDRRDRLSPQCHRPVPEGAHQLGDRHRSARPHQPVPCPARGRRAEQRGQCAGYAVLDRQHRLPGPKTEDQAARTRSSSAGRGRGHYRRLSLNSTLPKVLLDSGVPVVLASVGDHDDPRVGMIDQDDVGAMETIVDHLYSLGHRRFAFVSYRLREHSGERRFLGFKAALEEAAADADRDRRRRHRPWSPTTTCRRSSTSWISWSAAASRCRTTFGDRLRRRRAGRAQPGAFRPRQALRCGGYEPPGGSS